MPNHKEYSLFDRDWKKISIEKPTPMHFIATGTCGGTTHVGIWEVDTFDKRIETITSVPQLQEYVQAWANELLHSHELTGCITRPHITISAGVYVFNV